MPPSPNGVAVERREEVVDVPMVPPSRLQQKMDKIIIPSIEFRSVNIRDVIKFLVDASVAGDPASSGVNVVLNLGDEMPAPPAPVQVDDPFSFDDPGDFDLDPVDEPATGGGGERAITLSLRRVSMHDAIRYITEVANLSYRIEDNAILIGPRGRYSNDTLAGVWYADDMDKNVDLKTPSMRFENKLEKIIIPSIEFRSVKINDVVTFLVDASIAGDPEKVGVNIILDERNIDPEQRRITLSLRRVNLHDALRYITEVANLKFRIDDNAVFISPPGVAHGRMITNIYPVQPSLIEKSINQSEFDVDSMDDEFVAIGGRDTSTAPVGETDVAAFFKARGVPFNDGSSVKYDEASGSLIVQNTPENIALFERVAQRVGGVSPPERKPGTPVWAVEGASSLYIDLVRSKNAWRF
ncbi:MAG: STN domain-containing protein, partial [Verrucomicrobiota bacterium]